MTRILIVEDDLEVAGTVTRLLKRNGYEVLTLTSAQGAVEIALRQAPDVIILDILMPGVDGLELCRRLRTQAQLASTPLLFLTALNATSDIVTGLEAGADDYLAKPFAPAEFIARIKALLRRGQRTTAPGDAMRPSKRLVLDRQRYRVLSSDAVINLTPVEFDLLIYLLDHHGRAISTYELLHKVWGYPAGSGSANLVRSHIRRLRMKIEPDPGNPRYILNLPGHGYLLAADAFLR